MINRRDVATGLAGYLCFSSTRSVYGQTDVGDRFDQLIYPPIEAIDEPISYGYSPATDAQKRRAQEAIDQTRKGPKPIDVAQSFVDRFYTQDPEMISQWPAPSAWNPLVVSFFQATTYHANNDMVAWCAAFANWCIEWTGRTGTKSAASQSFLSAGFSGANDPAAGDLAVFTCYDKLSGRSLGIGHVTFFKQRLAADRIRVVGGNQSNDGHSSIICERDFLTSDIEVRRHIGNNYVPCIMRLNKFLRVT